MGAAKAIGILLAYGVLGLSLGCVDHSVARPQHDGHADASAPQLSGEQRRPAPGPTCSAQAWGAADRAQPRPTLSLEQRVVLRQWFERVAPIRAGETFGRLVARAGRTQLGVPYADTRPELRPETLDVDLNAFECVSFVESTLALARCLWRRKPTPKCFVDEVRSLRYRHGILAGYASRLHYFSDWLADNARRGKLQPRTAQLGGAPHRIRFGFMSHAPLRFPALHDPSIRARIRATEKRLSRSAPPVVRREHIAAAQPQMRSGDVVAVVSSKPGLRVSHAGFVVRLRRGPQHPRLMHASSFHERVVLTVGSISDYMLRRPRRTGLMLFRPLPPRGTVAKSAPPAGPAAPFHLRRCSEPANARAAVPRFAGYSRAAAAQRSTALSQP